MLAKIPSTSAVSATLVHLWYLLTTYCSLIIKHALRKKHYTFAFQTINRNMNGVKSHSVWPIVCILMLTFTNSFLYSFELIIRYVFHHRLAGFDKRFRIFKLIIEHASRNYTTQCPLKTLNKNVKHHRLTNLNKTFTSFFWKMKNIELKRLPYKL